MKKEIKTKVNDQLRTHDFENFDDLKRNCENIISDEDIISHIETYPSFDSFVSHVRHIKQNKETVFEDIFDEDLKKPLLPNDLSIKFYVDRFPSFDSFVNHVQILLIRFYEKELFYTYSSFYRYCHVFRTPEDFVILKNTLLNLKKKFDKYTEDQLISLFSNKLNNFEC